LIVLGRVHGNEVAGPLAIGRALAELDAGRWRIERGCVTFVPVTNPLAHARGQRTGERNLNRNLRPTAVPQDFEDRIGNVLCPLLDAHDVLLDLHSFNGLGEAFTLFGPEDNTDDLEPFAHAADEARLARHLGPKRIVEGWLRTYEAGVARRRAAHRRSRYPGSSSLRRRLSPRRRSRPRGRPSPDKEKASFVNATRAWTLLRVGRL
jgi:predicted deacylase